MLKIIACNIIIIILDSKIFLLFITLFPRLKKKKWRGGGGVKTQL